MHTTPKTINHKPLRAQVRAKNQITLPREVCEITGLKEGEYVVFHVATHATKVAPGSVVLSPHTLSARPWSTAEWKEKEREADEDIRSGRVSAAHDNARATIRALKQPKNECA